MLGTTITRRHYRWITEPGPSGFIRCTNSQGFDDGGVWEDVTDEAANFYRKLSEAPPVPLPVGLHLLVRDLPLKGANLRRNVDEGRIAVVHCVALAT